MCCEGRVYNDFVVARENEDGTTVSAEIITQAATGRGLAAAEKRIEQQLNRERRDGFKYYTVGSGPAGSFDSTIRPD